MSRILRGQFACRCAASISAKVMFSSCSPSSALAAGVKIGSGSFCGLLQARRAA